MLSMAYSRVMDCIWQSLRVMACNPDALLELKATNQGRVPRSFFRELLKRNYRIGRALRAGQSCQKCRICRPGKERVTGGVLDRPAAHTPKPSTTRRVLADFFSILVTLTWPISAVLATCVPPQG